jgi:hypothetical protein
LRPNPCRAVIAEATRHVNVRAAAARLAFSMVMMAEMKRLVWTSCGAVSFLLCLATLALWLRSYWYRDILSFGRAGGNCHLVQSLLGRIHILGNLAGGCSGGFSYSGPDRLSPQAVWNGGMSGYPPQPEWHGGFIWQYYPGTYFADFSYSGPAYGRPPLRNNHRLIVIPCWCPAILFATSPALWLIRRSRGRRRRRIAAGLCPNCGYDMRATPQRCPECGYIPPPAPDPSATSSISISGNTSSGRSGGVKSDTSANRRPTSVN